VQHAPRSREWLSSVQVVLVSSIVPMIKGGGRLIVESTAQALTARGHEVEVFLVPFDDDPEHLVEQMAGLRQLPLRDAGERLICIRWPAHIVDHPNKAAWFIHHHRVFFDLWDSPWRPFPDLPEWRGLREMLRTADTRTLLECRDVFTNSNVVAARLQRYNGLRAEVLFPPLPDQRASGEVGPYGDFLLYPSRINPVKRQHIAIEAMAHVTTDVRLVIAGRPESDQYADRLLGLVDRYDLADRVQLLMEWVPQDTMDGLFSSTRAVIYIPLDEDSYGYPSLEAAAHARPIVTMLDAGGALEFVQDGVSGLVTGSEPEDLAKAFDRLFLDSDETRRMGLASAARAEELGISWDHVIPRLLGDPT
jgi:glycosyltransferase involved in cell wall biosynthesis